MAADKHRHGRRKRRRTARSRPGCRIARRRGTRPRRARATAPPAKHWPASHRRRRGRSGGSRSARAAGRPDAVPRFRLRPGRGWRDRPPIRARSDSACPADSSGRPPSPRSPGSSAWRATTRSRVPPDARPWPRRRERFRRWRRGSAGRARAGRAACPRRRPASSYARTGRRGRATARSVRPGQPGKPGPLQPGRDIDLREQHLGGAVAPGGERGEIGQSGFLVVGKPKRKSGLEARIILPAQIGGAGGASAEDQEEGDKDEQDAHGGSGDVGRTTYPVRPPARSRFQMSSGTAASACGQGSRHSASPALEGDRDGAEALASLRLRNA